MSTWRRVETPTERWVTMLALVRDEQDAHPDKACEVFYGDPSTAALYRRRLENGYVPTTTNEITLDTKGFEFVVRYHGNKARLLCRWVGNTPRRTPLKWIGSQEVMPV